jgi:FkbM family methyltransferase
MREIMIDKIKSKIPARIKRKVRRLIDPKYRDRQNEIHRLQQIPRRKKTTTSLLGNETHIIDSASFLSAYRAIFTEEIYIFEPTQTPPRILDVGANIGLATLYWKRHFPDAQVTAFEPDPEIFDILKTNVKKHGYGDVTLVQKGLWSEKGKLEFQPDGADAGHMTSVTDAGAKGNVVPVRRLVPYLDERVDMLKLDIEGAEAEVLLDAADHLEPVQNLFVEYHSFVGKEQRVDEILRVLRQSGFRIHVQPELVADRPFVQRLESYGMDHRLNIFAYRE